MPDVPLQISPLSEREKGRGVHLATRRLDEIRGETLRLVSLGYKQYEVARALGASRSRLSRWCKTAVMQTNGPLRLVTHRGDGRTLTQMMWDRIDVRGRDDCWPWLGRIKANGYGAFNYRGRTRHAHRLVYETLIGDIPEGQQIDHICSNRGCVNPRHLQVVTATENLMLAARRQTHA